MPPRGYKPVKPTEPKPKKPRAPGAHGVPFVFDQATINQVEKMMAAGLSKAFVCSILGIDHTTLAKNAGANAQLKEAMERGLANAAKDVGIALVKKAKSGDVGAVKWWEQTRLGYRERQSHTHTGADGGPIEVVATHLSMNQLEGESERDYLARLRAGTEALLARRREEQGEQAPDAEG